MEFNISWSDIEAQRSGFALPDPGEQEFEITDVKTGQQKSGDNMGAPYINIRVSQLSGGAPNIKSAYKFLGLGTKPNTRGNVQLGETKAFLIDIGRTDILESGTFNPDELIGTTFMADVSIQSRKDDPSQKNVYFNAIKPISHAVNVDDGPVVESVQPEPVVVAPQPAPATNRRAAAMRK